MSVNPLAAPDIRRVVVGIDGSEPSRTAFAFGAITRTRDEVIQDMNRKNLQAAARLADAQSSEVQALADYEIARVDPASARGGVTESN